jgi:hypothetical protein
MMYSLQYYELIKNRHHGKSKKPKKKIQETSCENRQATALEARISYNSEERRGCEMRIQWVGGVGVGIPTEGRMDDGVNTGTHHEMEEGTTLRRDPNRLETRVGTAAAAADASTERQRLDYHFQLFGGTFKTNRARLG